LDLDVTSPLRTLQDLSEALDKLVSNPKAVNIFSVNPASRNPYFNMVEETVDGFVKVVKDSKGYKTRQEAPAVYDMNASFYFFRRAFFKDGYEISTTPRSLAYVMNHICFDLDHAHDFIIMETLLKNNILTIG
jgi:CMP-N-acetylneuraminic acid synthetase